MNHGVRALLTCLLTDAIKEAEGSKAPLGYTNASAQDTKRERNRTLSRHWLNGARMGPVTFAMTCDGLGLEPTAVQDGLRKREVIE